MNIPPFQKHTPSISETIAKMHTLAREVNDEKHFKELVRGLCLDLAKNIKELKDERKDC